MTTTDPGLDRSDVTRVTAGFARSLSADGLIARTPRLETRLSWPGSPDALFTLEAAMAAAWPCVSRPTHELIWIAEAKAPRGRVKIRAFDADGRLLLDRRYGVALDLSAVQDAPAYAHG